MCRRICEAFGSDILSHLAIYDLDRKLKPYLDFQGGTFIEVGGNDGLRQSNTYWFERFRGWRGILVEALPDQARRCRKNRPKAHVVHAALVEDASITSVKIVDANLMAYIPGTRTADEEAQHLRYALETQGLTGTPEIEVPATTLAQVLETRGDDRPFDLLSLDVEGYEIPVLRGMHPARHRPRYILVETRDLPAVLKALEGYYRTVDQLSSHDYLLVTDSPK